MGSKLTETNFGVTELFTYLEQDIWVAKIISFELTLFTL